jgi:hypothetical protein
LCCMYHSEMCDRALKSSVTDFWLVSIIFVLKGYGSLNFSNCYLLCEDFLFIRSREPYVVIAGPLFVVWHCVFSVRCWEARHMSTCEPSSGFCSITTRGCSPGAGEYKDKMFTFSLPNLFKHSKCQAVGIYRWPTHYRGVHSPHRTKDLRQPIKE